METTSMTWMPTDDDRRHLDVLRVAFRREGQDAPSVVALISYALRIAATASSPTGRLSVPGLAALGASKAGAEDAPVLLVDPGLILVANTDGACSGNPGPGGWAVVFSQGGEILGKHSGGALATTNNRMELMAIREALRQAPADVAVEIVTDSQNCIGWLSKGWKRNAPDVAAICLDIDTQLAARKVAFRWVRGHDGDTLNEQADRVAVAAIPG